ncbi:MAG: M1 family metallopeptidase [candidate division KSB1 bacterium]|nr:M1 family metallopeptidase [candidate division KSB1 bacterium]
MKFKKGWRPILLIWLIASIFHEAQSQPIIFEKPLSPRIANYDIDVRLDPEKKMIFGKELLTWFNKTGQKITELQFHLYWNAFRNNQSTFMIESGIKKDIEEQDWGYIEINHIALSTGEVLTASLQFIQPDDDNMHDRTVARLPLPWALLPDQSIQLSIDFAGKIPQPPIAVRSVAEKEYFFISQWFPKIGVFSNGQWNCHQYHRHSEFFADYGVYDVRITVPEKNVVGATGVEIEVKPNGDGTATHYYHAEDVHDFAWTTSPEFIEVTGKVHDVDVRVLLQPDHHTQVQRHLDAAKVAIEYFQNWYGDYPYPNLTIVDPRRKAMTSGGMEYPTLITAGTFYGLPKGLRMLEMVIIHEFGHNFWYHLVANNEFEEPWLDEGINSYSESQILADHYGPIGDMIDFLGIKINDLQLQRAQYINSPDLDPIVKKSWEFYSSGSYGVNSYQKPALMLTTLQNYLGKETLQKIMRTYFERWKFKHPRTEDFIHVANEISGQDLSWFFDQALFSTAELDYSVDRVFTRPIKKHEGYDFTLKIPDQDSTNELHQSFQIRKDSLSTEVDSVDTSIVKFYYSGVDVRRLGDFQFPVEIEIVFENGEKIREHWDGKDLWKKFRYTKPRKLVSATVDPDRKIPIDLNFTNNSRSVESHAKGVNKLAIRFLFWMQLLLDQPEILNAFTGFNLNQ